MVTLQSPTLHGIKIGSELSFPNGRGKRKRNMVDVSVLGSPYVSVVYLFQTQGLSDVPLSMDGRSS